MSLINVIKHFEFYKIDCRQTKCIRYKKIVEYYYPMGKIHGIPYISHVCCTICDVTITKIGLYKGKNGPLVIFINFANLL